MRYWICSTIFSALFFVSFAGAAPGAAPVTFKDFELVNISTTTAANDLTVTFNQPITKIQSNRILTPGGKPTGNNFSMAVGSPNIARPETIKYTNPTNGQTVGFLASVQFTVGTDAAQVGVGLSVIGRAPGSTTFFTTNNNPIPAVPRLVAANVDVTQDPGTGVASVSIGNPTDDFLFLTNLEVWTGLTAAQATTFDANGDFVTANLPPVSNYTLASLALSPDQSEAPVITIGPFSNDDGNYVVALYNLADGPDSNVSDATQLGQFLLSTNDAVVPVPEPPSLVLLVCGLAALGPWGRRVAGRISGRRPA
jgi:hypothetical protein